MLLATAVALKTTVSCAVTVLRLYQSSFPSFFPFPSHDLSCKLNLSCLLSLFHQAAARAQLAKVRKELEIERSTRLDLQEKVAALRHVWQLNFDQVTVSTEFYK